jgi:hypothetical protein
MRISLRESWNTFTVLGKIAVKNLKEYKTKLYFAIKVSVIKIDNDFNHRNLYRVSQTFKFRRYLYFRQVVRSSN